jgi:large subunit ribosomal protein L19e
MNLRKRKELAARVLGVGKNRVIFDPEHLAEIKEAITKQDIRDMYADGIIYIIEKKGRKFKKKRSTRRGFGKIKKMINPGKAAYIIKVRKQRKYIKELLLQNKLDKEQYYDLRKKIRASTFKNKAHLKDHIKTK